MTTQPIDTPEPQKSEASPSKGLLTLHKELKELNEPNNLEWLDSFIQTYIVDQHTCNINLLPCTYCEVKAAITAKINEMQTESYKKGFIDGSVDQITKHKESLRKRKDEVLK